MSKSFYKLVFFIIVSIQIQAQKKNGFGTIFEKAIAVSAQKKMSPLLLQVYTINAHENLSIAKNVVIIVLCSALIGSVLHFRSKQRKQRSKLRNIIRNLQKSTAENSEILPNENETVSGFANSSIEEVSKHDEEIIKRRNESLMTSETETKLLELLHDFEKGTLFNNKNMSLPFLAGELNTNTKYLSYVINQHKSSDFKSYINRLRINYIVDKLVNDEKYRHYKISILADECGFSSHSKFAAVFKIVTDYSPSAYIKLLESGNQ